MAGVAPSTLLVPGSASTGHLVAANGKRHRTLHVDAWKKLLRLRREAADEGFQTTFTCRTCRQPITMTVPHPTEPRLECGCTQWVGR
jgi:hypothetical protein